MMTGALTPPGSSMPPDAGGPPHRPVGPGAPAYTLGIGASGTTDKGDMATGQPPFNYFTW